MFGEIIIVLVLDILKMFKCKINIKINVGLGCKI